MAVPRTVSPASSRAPSRQDSSSSSSLLNDSGLALSRRHSDGSSCSSLDLSADPTDEAYAYHRRAAAELNNCAVALLEASQPREAVEAFGEAIRAAKRAHSILEDKAAVASSTNDSALSLDSDDDSAVISLAALGVTESCEARMRAHASLDTALLQKRSNNIDDASTGTTGANTTSTSASTGGSQRDALQRGLCGSRGLMAYTQPLRLDASQSNLTAGHGHEDIEGDETEARLSSGRRDLAVIMFNMALTHHIRGCQTNSDKSFKKALTSYNIAHSVFCQSRLASGAAVANKHEGRDELLRTALLNLALLNNMGQIISELGQDDVARQYFDGLSRLIGGANEDGGDDDVTDAVKRCWDGFEMNVLFSLSCPSPAA
jgi:tetratricopeptide (TPR) repeat protein